ncbi:MAG TPA: PPC domain-containing DNA-binding protein [Candidatus Limnocylindria bacterium]|nr:PPC domain-containing DNA-binding protein [Candidatus Limnocylindria bacterium]
MATRFWEARAGRAFVGRLETGSDLVEEIERFCLEQSVMAAQVTVIGAVRRARYAYYEQDDHRYRELETDTHHEITGFVGNISLKDDRPFLHAHATFADADGATVGGHLLRGIQVFAAEVMIREMGGVTLTRMHDEETGLSLW